MAGAPGGDAVTDVPPTRYRVVERGRRLEVIDSWTGQPAVPAPSVAPPPSLEESDRPMVGRESGKRPGLSVDARGRRVITTRRWFDQKGPRRITVSGAGERMLGNLTSAVIAVVVVGLVAGLFFPPLWFSPLVIVARPVRIAVKQAITARLDAIEATSER